MSRQATKFGAHANCLTYTGLYGDGFAERDVFWDNGGIKVSIRGVLMANVSRLCLWRAVSVPGERGPAVDQQVPRGDEGGGRDHAPRARLEGGRERVQDHGHLDPAQRVALRRQEVSGSGAGALGRETDLQVRRALMLLGHTSACAILVVRCVAARRAGGREEGPAGLGK